VNSLEVLKVHLKGLFDAIKEIQISQPYVTFSIFRVSGSIFRVSGTYILCSFSRGSCVVIVVTSLAEIQLDSISVNLLSLGMQKIDKIKTLNSYYTKASLFRHLFGKLAPVFRNLRVNSRYRPKKLGTPQKNDKEIKVGINERMACWHS